MATMQPAADSMQALFPCNYTGYDNNKGQVLASVYYHYNLSCSLVEWIDDSSLKVTLSINLMFVQR